MREATLTRWETGPEGTFGDLVAGDFKCVTVELPWMGNAKGKSCIPAGAYTFRWRTDSPAHGEVYEADPDDEAPGRTNIQVHAANLAGDIEQGFVSQLEGCIAPGRAIIKFKGGKSPAGEKDQWGIVSSKPALQEFVEVMKKEPFALKIQWGEGVLQETA